MPVLVRSDPSEPLELSYRLLSQWTEATPGVSESVLSSVSMNISANGIVEFTGVFPAEVMLYAIEIEVTDNRTICRELNAPPTAGGCVSVGVLRFYPTWLEDCSNNVIVASSSAVSSRWREPSVNSAAPSSALSWNNSHSQGSMVATEGCISVLQVLLPSWPVSVIRCDFQVGNEKESLSF